MKINEINNILEAFLNKYKEVAQIVKDEEGYNVIEDGQVLLDHPYTSLRRLLIDLSKNLEE